ncbi:hypothetical protein D9M72_409770 [compost metagenome]
MEEHQDGQQRNDHQGSRVPGVPDPVREGPGRYGAGGRGRQHSEEAHPAGALPAAGSVGRCDQGTLQEHLPAPGQACQCCQGDQELQHGRSVLACRGVSAQRPRGTGRCPGQDPCEAGQETGGAGGSLGQECHDRPHQHQRHHKGERTDVLEPPGGCQACSRRRHHFGKDNACQHAQNGSRCGGHNRGPSPAPGADGGQRYEGGGDAGDPDQSAEGKAGEQLGHGDCRGGETRRVQGHVRGRGNDGHYCPAQERRGTAQYHHGLGELKVGGPEQHKCRPEETRNADGVESPDDQPQQLPGAAPEAVAQERQFEP